VEEILSLPPGVDEDEFEEDDD